MVKWRTRAFNNGEPPENRVSVSRPLRSMENRETGLYLRLAIINTFINKVNCLAYFLHRP